MFKEVIREETNHQISRLRDETYAEYQKMDNRIIGLCLHVLPDCIRDLLYDRALVGTEKQSPNMR